jgi:hypothetical protein
VAEIVIPPWLVGPAIVDRLLVAEHLHHYQVVLEVLCL